MKLISKVKSTFNVLNDETPDLDITVNLILKLILKKAAYENMN